MSLALGGQPSQYESISPVQRPIPGLIYPSRSLSDPWRSHWEKRHVGAHLARLQRLGQVERTDDGCFIRVGK